MGFPRQNESGMPLHVLQGTRSVYQVHSPQGMIAFDAYNRSKLPAAQYINSVSGVVDIEGNGLL
jgi:hypothetical protein